MSTVNVGYSAVLTEAEGRAYQYLHDGRTQACSQTVLVVVQEVLGQVDGLLLKACGPMAGGSRVGSICGALVSALLSVGMRYGAGLEELR